MKHDVLGGLEELDDEELQAVIDRARELLKAREVARKKAAIEQARTVLAAAGLTFRDVGSKGGPKAAKERKGASPQRGQAATYRPGWRYQHPKKPNLVWLADDKKPSWVHKLEAAGQRAIELSPEAAGEGSGVQA